MSKWIDAEIELPPKYGHYLCVNSRFRKGKPTTTFVDVRWFDTESGKDEYVSHHYDRAGWMHISLLDGSMKTNGTRVSHWMPLPTPPTQQDKLKGE